MSKNSNKTRDFKESEFIKTIGITLEDFNFINLIKHKKSKAGKLKEIINYYKNISNNSQ